MSQQGTHSVLDQSNVNTNRSVILITIIKMATQYDAKMNTVADRPCNHVTC